ncbi:dihydrodipicolinate synthase family protein [Cytobacillus solani]|uniref:dihydrodipicolinate synthase family protein n=1 Tax=Cytobacillus solani TaxID=1637975 RepID=UPI0011513D6A|nr:dihydrodipicolinate synthase family protein [Cytobacillus solani]USK57111.1 dihydrodipicolinate synthase family protein [Cytobacillus solani]
MLTEKVHIAVPTAFYEDESLNVQGTISHIRNLNKQGVKSVLVSGTTGEQHSLNLQEKFDIIDGLELEEELMNNMEVIFGVASIKQRLSAKEGEKIDKIMGQIYEGNAIVNVKKVINQQGIPIGVYRSPIGNV